jgi:hypothetical protein
MRTNDNYDSYTGSELMPVLFLGFMSVLAGCFVVYVCYVTLF